ncbi:hypothetical protein [Bradyrhizobium sp.]|uniref:hypothetical protein n=1 Tax=Bradyrhizobium sp. TaxID=376 RepID=UPI004037F89F
MRKTEASGWMVQARLTRAARFTAVAFGIGLVMAAGPVRAADDEDDDMTFEEKIIDNIMRGVGGTNMENRGIDYRERSPLVVPPKLNLPPPGAAEVKAQNWPKDPDEARRKAAIAARKKESKDPQHSARTLLPSELNQKSAGRSTGGESVERPGSAPIMMTPSQLGYEGGVFGFFKGNTSESAEFKGEPTRDSLTQPPTGYQTPSPNFAYGTGPKESLNKQYDVMSGKER